MKKEIFIPTVDLTDPLNPKSNVLVKKSKLKLSSKGRRLSKKIKILDKEFHDYLRRKGAKIYDPNEPFPAGLVNKLKTK